MSDASRRPDKTAIRRESFQRLAELQRLAAWHIESRRVLDWLKWAYCMAAVLRMDEPGRRLSPVFHKGKLLQGRYWLTWPECTPGTMLTGCTKRAPLKSMASVPVEIIADLERGIARARRRKRKGFMSADAVADMLDVTLAIRTELDLRFIGAMDFRKTDRIRARAEKNRADTRERMALQRRAEGAKPREQYEAMSAQSLAPWAALGMSRRTFYRLDKSERDRLIAAARQNGTGAFGNHSPSEKESIHRRANIPVPSQAEPLGGSVDMDNVALACAPSGARAPFVQTAENARPEGENLDIALHASEQRRDRATLAFAGASNPVRAAPASNENDRVIATKKNTKSARASRLPLRDAGSSDEAGASSARRVSVSSAALSATPIVIRAATADVESPELSCLLVNMTEPAKSAREAFDRYLRDNAIELDPHALWRALDDFEFFIDGHDETDRDAALNDPDNVAHFVEIWRDYPNAEAA